MRVGEKTKRVHNPKRWVKPVELPAEQPIRVDIPEREKVSVPVRREENANAR